MADSPINNETDTFLANLSESLDPNQDTMVMLVEPQFDKQVVTATVTGLLFGKDEEEKGVTVRPVFELQDEVEDTKGNKHAPGLRWSPRFPLTLIPANEKRAARAGFDQRDLGMLCESAGLLDGNTAVGEIITALRGIEGKNVIISFKTRKSGKTGGDGELLINQNARYLRELPAVKSNSGGDGAF
tara:strand:+ start:533 stop:1090 length:558 start_codon:yes stop_codon:yes gene_type:complete